MTDNLFAALLKRGHIKDCDEGRKLFMKFRLFSKIFILSYDRCQDISDAWEYTITDRFGNVLVTNQYTKL